MANESNPTRNEIISAAKEIWAITQKSPSMGNAVMDVIGEAAYKNVMKLQAENAAE